MNIYKISQDQNDDYDTYDSAIVAAENKEIARNMNPSNGAAMSEKDWAYAYSSWCNTPDAVKVELIGIATDGILEGVLVASFNAG
jgi:hypothetical protein